MTSPAPLTLALVEDDGAASPTPAPAQPAVPDALRDLRINDADAMLAAVLDEVAAGKVDHALWAHSVTQANGDDALAAPLYLRARATAIRIERRGTRDTGASAAAPADASPDAPGAGAPRGTTSATRTRAAAGTTPRGRAPERDGAPGDAARRAVRWKLAAIGAALAVVVSVGAVAWLARGGDDPATVRARTATRVAAKEAAAKARPKATPAGTADAATTEPSFAHRVAELEQAGNWNVLVLYATEWTRKEPTNAAAWRKLAQGYVKLGQMPEAAEAAARAAQLAPADPGAWRDAARVNVALERWPQAHDAFDHLLALAPTDAPALCSAAYVARREGRFPDADALGARASAAGNACSPEATAATLAVSAPVPRR
jgi:hypothetical protein